MASAAEAIRLIKECPRERIAVEEQDHKCYVLHHSNEPILWIVVGRETLIFPELLKLHEEWMREHPRWSGWVAF